MVDPVTWCVGMLRIYGLLPKALREAVEGTAEAWVAQVIQRAGGRLADEALGPREMRRIKATLARAVALTLAKHPRLDTIAYATDFRRSPFADEVLRILEDPRAPVDEERVREALRDSPYDLQAIDLDGAELLEEIRRSFTKLLKRDRQLSEVWNTAVIDRMSHDVFEIRDDVEKRREIEAAASPLLTPEQFFSPWMSPRRLFTHSWGLVGRTEVKERLVEFGAHGTEQRIVVLPGRGGMGKSRLLLAVLEEIEAAAPDVTVRVLHDSYAISAEDLATLPPGPALVVIDDAHRRDDLDVVLGVCLRRPETRILLAVRPYGTDSIRARAARIGFDPSDLLVLENLSELTRDERIELARQALGPSHGHLADPLAKATGDSPLVTVVGGRLLAEESVPPALLAQHEGFRDVVLGRMARDYVHAVGEWCDASDAARTLELVSAISPFNRDDDDLVAQAATFVDISPELLRRILGELEAAGVLVRRGRFLRISPDVLADHLYYRAAVSGGASTGYAERVVEEFQEQVGFQVLNNLAELDWRVRQAHGDDVDLLSTVWESVVEGFRSAANFERIQVLEQLERVALFQPRKVLQLAQIVMDARGPDPEVGSQEATDDPPWAYWSVDDVRGKLPPLLERIAFHPEHRSAALDYLWELSHNDSRPTHQHPDHPIRCLQDLAGYDSGRLDIPYSVLEAVGRWMDDIGSQGHAQSALDVVDPILEKAGSRSYADGYQISFQPFFVDPDKTEDLRRQALALVERCLRTPDLSTVLRAVKSLETAARDPMVQFGSSASEELRSRWVPEQLRVMEILRREANEASDPLVTLQALNALSWHAVHSGQEALRTTARSIIDGIEWSFDLRLAKHMTAGTLRFDRMTEYLDAEEDEGNDVWERLQDGILSEERALATDFLARFPRAEEGYALLNGRLATMAAAGVDAAPGGLLVQLGQAAPDYAQELIESCLADAEAPLSLWLQALHEGLRLTRPEAAVEYAQRAARSDSRIIRGGAAICCTQAFRRGDVSEEYIALLRQLLRDPEVAVQAHSVRALQVLAHQNASLTMDLALEVELNSNSPLAAELFSATQAAAGGSFDDLEETAVTALLKKLDHVDDLSEYWIERFLDHASEVAPGEVVDLILRRAEWSATDEANGDDFRAMPYRFEASFSGFGRISEPEELLRNIRDMTLKRDGQGRSWLPDLFAAVSQGYGEPGRAILLEWIESGDAARVELAARLLRPADWRFVLSNAAFTVTLLERAHEAGRDCFDTVQLVLHAIVATRGGMGTPGEPMPQDVEARDAARAIAEGLPEGSVGRPFFDEIVAAAERSIVRARDLFDDMEK